MSCRFICTILILSFLTAGLYAAEYHLPVEKYVLPNGLVVILEEDHNCALASAVLLVRAGSCYEGRFMGSGITHLLEHMVFKGRESGTASSIARRFQAMGGELDAATTKEYTKFTITVRGDNMPKAMGLVYKVITEAGFAEDEFEKEKKVVLREMDSVEDTPEKFLTNEFFKLVFGAHPAGVPVIGYKDLFKKIRRKDILQYYHSTYIPANMILAVSGGFNRHELKKEIKNLWGCIPSSFFKREYIPKDTSVIGPVIKPCYRDVSGAYLTAGFRGPSADSRDLYPMDVVAEILGGGEMSRLAVRLREKLGLVSGIDAWSYTPSFSGVFGISARLTGTDWKKVMKNILKEAYRLRYEPVAKEELSRAKRLIIRRIIDSTETVSGRAADLASSEFYAGSPLFTKTYIKGIKGVTAEDVLSAARRYFSPRGFALSVLLPEGSKPVEEGSRLDMRNAAITRIELKNGIRVLVKEDTRLPAVSIRLVFLGGLLEEDIPGLSYFTAKLWLMGNRKIVRKIESLGGSIYTYSGNNSIGCVIRVFKKDAPAAMVIVYKLISSINIAPRDMKRQKEIQTARIKEEDDSPYGFVFKRARAVFFGHHPYRNSIMGTKESVNSITAQDVRRFFQRHIVPENMVLSIFGNISKDAALHLSFELRKWRSNYTFTEKNNEAPHKSVRKRYIRRNTQQAVIAVLYPGVSVYSKDRFAVELLEEAFSGQAGRLFEDIREDRALSYTVGALNIMGRERGAFVFYMAVNPPDVEGALQYLFRQAERIKKEGIKEEELSRIKERLLTKTQEYWESVDGLSQEVSLDELYGLGADYYKKYTESIKDVQAEDIKAAAERYLNDKWHTVVVAWPVKDRE